jgi:hypothetical protein
MLEELRDSCTVHFGEWQPEMVVNCLWESLLIAHQPKKHLRSRRRWLPWRHHHQMHGCFAVPSRGRTVDREIRDCVPLVAALVKQESRIL